MGRGALIRVAAVVVAGSGGAGGLGCGREAAPPVAAPAGPVDLTARAAGPDDTVVARVDGRPVWASCVAAQAAGRGIDRQAALADCVDLELLAGAAVARGLAGDPEVASAGRAAGAVRLVDRGFRERYRRPADLPAEVLNPDLERYAWRLNRPETRASYLVRINVPATAVGGATEVAAARAIQAAYATVGQRDDLFGADVLAAVEQAVAAGGAPLKVVGASPDPTGKDFGLMPYYRAAVFAIPTIGRVAPPLRSDWGWDLILWTDVRRPAPMTRDQLADERFEALRQRFFATWVGRIMDGHAVAVADEPSLRKLWGEPTAAPQPGPPARSAPPGAPGPR